jgi:hypothetical protein
VLLATSDACPQQAFAIGPHLAMQFHVELDEPKLQAWVRAHDPRHRQAREYPTVHDGSRMVEDTGRFLQQQQALADRIYATWLS